MTDRRHKAAGGERFGHFFQPRLAGVQASGPVTTLRDGPSFLPGLIIISRQLCSFERIRLPANSREGIKAATFQARQNPRFKNASIRIEPDTRNDRSAGLWTWEGETLVNGRPLSDLNSLPESLAREPMEEGERLIACLEGVEGQIWTRGILIASRWWPDEPSEREWSLFLRAGKGADWTGSSEKPNVKNVGWRDDLPIVDRRPEAISRLVSPRRVAIATLALLTAYAAFLGASMLGNEASLARSRQKLEALTAANQEAYAARGAAIAGSRSIDRLGTLADPAHHFQMLSDLSGAVDTDLGELAFVQVTEDNVSIRFRLYGAVDLTEMTRTLEALPTLSSVAIANANENQVTLEATLPPAPDLAAVAGRAILTRDSLATLPASEDPEAPDKTAESPGNDS